MSLHYSDPSKARRQCPGCGGIGQTCEHGCEVGFRCEPCDRDVNPAWTRMQLCREGCDGSGQINADAKPDIEVKLFGAPAGVLAYRFVGTPEWVGPYFTEATAVAAARAAR